MTAMKINHFSTVLHMNMDVRLLLPKEIDKGEQLKVLWLLHGGSGDENEWLYYSTVAMLPDERHLAIVLVNADDSCFVDMPYGKKYGTYIGKELPDQLYQMFRCLSSKREDNYICGLSNGGYGAFIVGLKNCDRYAAIGAFSAGDKADAKPKPYPKGEINPRVRMFGQEHIQDTEYSIKFLARKTAQKTGEKPRIYHACGSLDPWLDLNLLVKACFEELKDSAFDYTYHQADGMGHEWRFWDQEVRNFLDYLNILDVSECFEKA